MQASSQVQNQHTGDTFVLVGMLRLKATSRHKGASSEMEQRDKTAAMHNERAQRNSAHPSKLQDEWCPTRYRVTRRRARGRQLDCKSPHPTKPAPPKQRLAFSMFNWLVARPVENDARKSLTMHSLGASPSSPPTHRGNHISSIPPPPRRGR